MRATTRPPRWRSCITCDGPGPSPCRRCAALLEPAPIGPLPDGVDALVALLSLEGIGRVLVHRWKFDGRDDALGPLAMALHGQLGASGAPAGLDAVTWAPTAPARRRARGRDQAQALADAVARLADVPLVGLLARAPSRAQTGRSRAERLSGPRFAALASSPPRVLVVDDVVTTGATLAAAAAAAGALRSAGASCVVAAVVARTPLARASPPH